MDDESAQMKVFQARKRRERITPLQETDVEMD